MCEVVRLHQVHVPFYPIHVIDNNENYLTISSDFHERPFTPNI